MIVNGVTISDPDVADAAFVERFENAQQTCVEKMEAVAKEKIKWSESIRRQCEAVFQFFEDVFGEGAAKTVFGESVNLRICIDAYAEASNGIKALDKNLGAYFRGKADGFNRQQRRKNKNKKARKK